MHFTKVEREALKNLSLKIYNRTSMWDKIHKNVQIPYKKYTQLEMQYDSGPGNRTLTRGNRNNVDRYATRLMTYNELISYMFNVLDNKVMSKIRQNNPELLEQVFAKRLVKNELVYDFHLKKELTDDEFNNKIKDFPEFVQDILIKSTKEMPDAAKVTVFNQLSFLNLLEQSLQETDNEKVDQEVKEVIESI